MKQQLCERTLILQLPVRLAEELRLYCAARGDCDPAEVIESVIRRVALVDAQPRLPDGQKFKVIEGGRK